MFRICPWYFCGSLKNVITRQLFSSPFATVNQNALCIKTLLFIHLIPFLLLHSSQLSDEMFFLPSIPVH